MPAQNQQPAGLVGQDRTQIDWDAHEGAIVEALFRLAGTGDGACPGMMASARRSMTIGLRRVVGVDPGIDASGMSSASWKPYQAAFLLANCTVQVMSSVRAGQFPNGDACSIQTIDTETRRLSL